MGKRMLIVDDDAMILKLVSAVLTPIGAQILTATNGEAALHILESNPPPLVITDWEMPGMNGLELCRRIRALHDPGEITILMLTGSTGRQHMEEALAAGADDFITKPIVRDKFLERINEAFRQIEASQAQAIEWK